MEPPRLFIKKTAVLKKAHPPGVVRSQRSQVKCCEAQTEPAHGSEQTVKPAGCHDYGAGIVPRVKYSCNKKARKKHV
jgi:hypothetical protein